MKLILVDSNVNSSSPTMRGIVASLNAFEDLFDEIEVWATNCEWNHPKVRVRYIPQRFKSWALQSHYYTHAVRKWADKLPRSPSQVIQSTGCILPKCDIRYIQFWNQLLLQEATKRPQLGLSAIHSLQSRMAAYSESKVISNPQHTGTWWVVSKALAESIKHLAGGCGTYQILPNQYNPSRFNKSVRHDWREKMRSHYGFQEDEKILAFSAFGHFERKGLRQAVEAVELLREMNHPVRLLILGGSPRTIAKFRNAISSKQAEGCIFAGLVDSIERHLVAADGFFFPSHFEAFSLAEIEAAALGLRLYLTPHYGSEMILRDPSNGRLLPWEPDGMANVIAEDINKGILGNAHTEMGDAINHEQYGIRLRELYQHAITSKSSR